MNAPPLSWPCNLAALSGAGYETVIHPEPAVLRGLAEWAGVVDITGFQARIHVRPLSKTRFAYEADIEADIVQSCVVTLEPVRSHIVRRVIRALHVARGVHKLAEKGGVLTLTPSDDETTEEIESPNYDLAVPVLEDLALAIDPYPRAPGVSFEVPADAADAPASPFATLREPKGTL